ncbi:MAG: hypothetical protein R3239_00235 [Thermodesulfobacteriota bacterium]|nr:hypothetical protein [Thermodesulfobacteriota bacterium]
MRKYLVVFVAVLALVAFSAPSANATDIKASGFYRAFPTLSNFQDGAGGPSLRDGTFEGEQTNAYVAQRFRVKWQFGSENVKAVWYLESDMNWGDSAGSTNSAAGRNFGGALGGDKVQTETKQINVWFKIPNTSIQSTVGLQGIGDSYSGVFGATNDMAGITIKGKYEPVSYRVVWAKLYENAYHKADDSTLYMAEVDFNPTKESQLGINFYFLQDDTGTSTTDGSSNSGAAGARLRPGVPGDVTSPYGSSFNQTRTRIYIPGINGAMKAGPVKISGWFFYEWGKAKSLISGTPDLDINGFAATLRGDMKVGPGKAFLQGLYLSGGDNQDDNKYKSVITLGDYQANASPGGYSGFTKLHMVMLLPTWNMASISQCFIGCSGGYAGDSLGNGGRGVWAVGAGYSQNFTDMLSGEANIGYLAATNLFQLDRDVGRDKPMGTEVNATLTANIQKGLTISGTAGYAWVGDFMRIDDTGDPTIPFTGTFKDAWTTYARVQYKY